jgi:hypothetical protein
MEVKDWPQAKNFNRESFYLHKSLPTKTLSTGGRIKHTSAFRCPRKRLLPAIRKEMRRTSMPRGRGEVSSSKLRKHFNREKQKNMNFFPSRHLGILGGIKEESNQTGLVE